MRRLDVGSCFVHIVALNVLFDFSQTIENSHSEH